MLFCTFGFEIIFSDDIKGRFLWSNYFDTVWIYESDLLLSALSAALCGLIKVCIILIGAFNSLHAG